MSQLRNLRHAIKTRLTAAGVLPAEQIIIDRHNDEWEVIGAAIAIAENGLVLHIAEASGRVTDSDDPDIIASVDVVLTLFCETVYHPNEVTDDAPTTTTAPPALTAPGTSPEEETWEAMVKALHHFNLPNATTGLQHCSGAMRLVSWSHIPNEFDYYARATTFVLPLHIVT